MDRFAAMRMFVRVVEAGSFTAVARELGIGQPAVSKTIATLEEELGVTLLRRTSRSLAITPAGQDLFDDVRPLLGELDLAFERITHGDRAPAGIVRLSVAPGFGRLYAVPAVRALRNKYPEISVELVASERHVDLVAENIDLAIRAGDLRGATGIAQRVGQTPLLTVASTSYLDRHREPRTLAELDQHDGVVFMSRGSRRAWRFQGADPNVIHPSRVALVSTNAEEIRAAVLADLGLAQVPGWLVAHDLGAGTIRAVLRPTKRRRCGSRWLGRRDACPRAFGPSRTSFFTSWPANRSSVWARRSASPPESRGGRAANALPLRARATSVNEVAAEDGRLTKGLPFKEERAPHARRFRRLSGRVRRHRQ